jgi:hypothetical protein
LELNATKKAYEQLLVENMALKETVAKGNSIETEIVEAPVIQPYVIVLIDAHSHKVCPTFTVELPS